MKTQHLFILLFSMLLGTPAIAQPKNVDIDNLRFSVTYRELPTKPLKPLFFTYTAQTNASKSTEQRISVDEISDAVTIAGQRKVDGGEEAVISVVINLGNLMVLNSSVAERKEEHKNKEGKITSTSYYYKVNVEYTFEASFKIMRGKEQLYTNNYISSVSKHVHSSDEYSSRKNAADYWNNNREVLVSEFARNLSLQTANAASKAASSQYGFPVIRTTDIIQTTDEKKHPENDAFRTACTALKGELESMTAETGMNREKVQEIIDYFKTIPERYTDPKLKADIKLRYTAYFNICKAYLYLDEPENVAAYADLLFRNDYDKKDGTKLQKTAEELLRMLSKTEITTRHFNTDDYFSE